MREHAVQAHGDRVGPAQVVGKAVGAEAVEQGGEPLVVALLAPRDLGVVADAAQIRLAIAGLVDQHAIEQELDPDVSDRAARTAGARPARQLGIELSHQAGDRGQRVKHGVGRVVQVDAGGDIGIVGRRHPRTRHRGEVGDHRAQREAGGARSPARHGCVTEEVHASYYHLLVLVIGIDLGTQSLKAVVCDDELRVRGRHAVAYPTSYPAPDRVEQDPRAWEAALGPAIGGALMTAGARPDEVAAIAIAGQLDGCVAVDAACRPLHPALIWQDRRAVAEAALADRDRVFAIAGQVADAGHLAPKAAWLRAAGIAATRWHQPVSYLVERLTGEAAIDPALASTCMLAELATGTWSDELLAAFGLAVAELPAIRPTSAIAGTLTSDGAKLTGLVAGIPVAVGTGDDFANPLGAGIVAPGPIAVALGTAEVVGAIAATPILDRPTDPADEPMVETHAYPTGAFFVENPGWLSGGAIEWAVRMLGFPSARALDAAAHAAPPGAAGVTFVPALAGAMTPAWRPHARGTLHGLAAGHDRGHVARAVLEGLAFACRDVVERLRELAVPGDRVVLLGGGARSRVWTQIRADALGIPHDAVAEPDTCPVGAALIASVAAGHHADLVTAAARLSPHTERFEPRTSLDDAYARYRRLVTQLAPLALAPWHTSQP